MGFFDFLKKIGGKKQEEETMRETATSLPSENLTEQQNPVEPAQAPEEPAESAPADDGIE